MATMSQPFVEGSKEGNYEMRGGEVDQNGAVIVDVDRKLEAKVLRKLDLYIVPILFIVYLSCFIDRANIGEYYPSLPICKNT